MQSRGLMHVERLAAVKARPALDGCLIEIAGFKRVRVRVGHQHLAPLGINRISTRYSFIRRRSRVLRNRVQIADAVPAQNRGHPLVLVDGDHAVNLIARLATPLAAGIVCRAATHWLHPVSPRNALAPPSPYICEPQPPCSAPFCLGIAQSNTIAKAQGAQLPHSALAARRQSTPLTSLHYLATNFFSLQAHFIVDGDIRCVRQDLHETRHPPHHAPRLATCQMERGSAAAQGARHAGGWSAPRMVRGKAEGFMGLDNGLLGYPPRHNPFYETESEVGARRDYLEWRMRELAEWAEGCVFRAIDCDKLGQSDLYERWDDRSEDFWREYAVLKRERNDLDEGF